MRVSLQDVEGTSFLGYKSVPFLWFSRITPFLHHSKRPSLPTQLLGTSEDTRLEASVRVRAVGRKMRIRTRLVGVEAAAMSDMRNR